MTREVSRRDALQLGAAGLAGIVTGGVGLSWTGLPWAPRTPASGRVDASLAEPAVLRSANGLLQVDLVAERSSVTLAGRSAHPLAYNGSVPGPTWVVRPGDRILVRLQNRLTAPTNLHTHGLAVSPAGNSDNPFVSVAPGDAFDYEFQLPSDHPSGVFWYHPHRHGLVADQIFGGLYGALLVVDADELSVARERVLIVSDITLTAAGDPADISTAEAMMGREGDMLLVNGQLQPQLAARPGERERWRVVNACTSRYLRLALPGQQLQLLGVDSGHGGPDAVEDVLLAPGNRADLLVTARLGTSELVTLGHDRGAAMGAMMGGGDLSGPGSLATLVVEGTPASGSPAVGPRRPDADLRSHTPDRRREITFTMGMGMGGAGGMGGMGGMGRGEGMMSFGFDGREFDHARTDQAVDAGTVEEWTIINPTPMDHPFHLHVWPMQLVEDDGVPVGAPTWRDVVNVSAGGRVRVLVDFSRHPGRSVYHCHILDHEDAGMMGTVEVR